MVRPDLASLVASGSLKRLPCSYGTIKKRVWGENFITNEDLIVSKPYLIIIVTDGMTMQQYDENIVDGAVSRWQQAEDKRVLGELINLEKDPTHDHEHTTITDRRLPCDFQQAILHASRQGHVSRMPGRSRDERLSEELH